jgi:hypothetical protein
MSSKQPKHRGSECPLSDAQTDRCNAGGPEQRRLKNHEALLGDWMERLNVKDSDNVDECTYCGVVYVNRGIAGMERILGKNTPQGFIPNQ